MNGERVLYVLRHAKSSWEEATLRDHDRPLAERGHVAVKAMAKYVAKQGIKPDLVLCSSATRAQQTLHGIYDSVQPVIDSALYGASAEEVIRRLREIHAETRSVMVVGHNPTLQMLVLKLAGGEQRDRPHNAEGLAEIRHKLPTGALVTLSFPGEWGELSAKQATLVDYVRPKSLK
jgi:phosphohistidine phosphatase